MSARFENFYFSVVPEMGIVPSKKPEVTELNTVHDFGVNYESDTLNVGGGKICVYIGEEPHMLDVLGRKPLYDEEKEIQGMEWYVKGMQEFGTPNLNGYQAEESIIRGKKDTKLYQFGATSGDEVFLLEREEARIIEFPLQNEYSNIAAD